MNIYKYFGNNPLFYVSDDHTKSLIFEAFSIESKDFLPKIGKYEQEPNDSYFATNSAYGPSVSSTKLEGNSSFETMNSFIKNSMLQTREDIFNERDSLCKKETESIINYSSKKRIEELDCLIEKNKRSYSVKLLGAKEDLTEYKNEDVEKEIFNILPNSIKYLLVLGNQNSDEIGQRHLSKTEEGLKITTIFNKNYVSKYVFAITE